MSLNNDPTFLQNKKKEFNEGIPLEEVLTENDGDLSSNRRDFLKYFGFSISAVALASCNKAPVKNVIPYIIKPENITPGIPNFYASTCGSCSATSCAWFPPAETTNCALRAFEHVQTRTKPHVPGHGLYHRAGRRQSAA